MTIDYRSFSQNGGSLISDRFDKRWWLEDEDTIAQSVFKIVAILQNYDNARLFQYNTSAKLYGNMSLMGMNGFSYSKTSTTQSTVKDRIAYNVTQAVIDTLTSKIGKSKPKSLFLTEGGNWKSQRRSKNLTKFCDGIRYENDGYYLGQLAFRDSLIMGDGLIHVYDYFGRVAWERCLPHEFFVDWLESIYGRPRQLHWRRQVDRYVLMDAFPSKKDLIKDANFQTLDPTSNQVAVADQLVVVESWHLPSSPDAKDGVHCINLPSGNLMKEKWEKPRFPFAKIPWCVKTEGYWAQSLAEQIQNIQLEINKLLWVIQRSMHLAGSFKWLIERGSRIVPEHISNDIGPMIMYSGTPPQVIVPPVVPMEYYSHLMNLKASAFEQAGISQLSAAALKPVGVSSGRALRELNTIETDRFATVGQAYERFHMDLDRLSIDTIKDIQKEKKGYKVKAIDRKFITTIDWKDVQLTEDEFVMKAYPVSSFPQDPAGRLETVQEFGQMGMYGPRTLRRLLDFPDLEQVEDLGTAQEDYIHKVLEKIVEDGEFTDGADGFVDFDLALELATEYYFQGKNNNLPEDRINLLIVFMNQIKDLKAAAVAEQQQQVQQEQEKQLAMQAAAKQAASPQSGTLSQNVAAPSSQLAEVS